MELFFNGRRIQTACRTLQELVPEQKELEIIYNGFQTKENHWLQPGDSVVMLKKGKMPRAQEMETMLMARHTPEVHKKIQQGTVAIAGLGGLGSHIAVMLARTGVGRLLLIDDDIVEPSNLNRQHYAMCHLGMPKTEALAAQLQQINPFVQVTAQQIRVTTDNAAALFAQWPLICEAFDDPAAKAMLVNTLLPDNSKTIVAASGMAGYGSSNAIQTTRKMGRLYICGDQFAEMMPGQSLMAPRVQICAGHQANMVLRLLLGILEP